MRRGGRGEEMLGERTDVLLRVSVSEESVFLVF